jgi:hypothetical protein
MIDRKISSIERIPTVLASEHISEIEILTTETHSTTFAKAFLGHSHSRHTHLQFGTAHSPIVIPFQNLDFVQEEQFDSSLPVYG